MNRRARIILKERRLELLDRAAAAAAADPQADIGAELAKAQTYERLIEALDGSSQRRRLMAALIGIACVTVVGTAQVVRVPTTRVSLSAEADSATFTLAEPWLWETPASGASAIRLVAFDDLDLPALMAAELKPSTKDPLDFAGDSLTLASLSIAPNARVTLEADGGSADLFVKGGHVAGELTLTGAVEVAGGMAAAGGDWLSARFDLPLPEIVTFAARPEGAIPAQLRIGRDEGIGFFNVAVRTLSFARERASGTGFESTIREGRLVIAETRREVPLRRGDHIEIGDAAEGRLVDAAIGDTLRVAFEGRAGSVVLVQAGLSTDLRPTLLEYVYHNEFVVFMWSALGVVWGLAWSIRRAVT